MHCARTRHGFGNRAGFSLLELTIVLMIAGVVAGVALPPLQMAARSTRLSTGSQQLLGDLRLARTEAIKRNTPVYVARTGAGTYHIQYIGYRSLPTGVNFVSAPDTLRFAAFGPVLTGSALYSLSLRDAAATIRVTSAGNALLE